MTGRFQWGFAHYPEHYPEDSWERDLRLMREAGAGAVRIAEFAWSRLEPREGQYEFGWLDRYFDLCGRHGMGVILGTPTAAPPPWARRRYPGIVLVEENGQPTATGGRRYTCPTSPDYRRLGEAITTRLAERYGRRPELIGWQTDNEIDGAVCHCAHCQAALNEWLRARHGTVAALNEALGLVFWAHEFQDWDEVDLLRSGGKKLHPSARLAIRRFFSAAWIEFLGRQVAAIRAHSPGRFVTHNLPGVNIPVDLFDLAAAHDFISDDLYPRPLANPRRQILTGSTVTRSLQRRPHWIMELSTGAPVTQFYKAPVPRPGEMRQWAHYCAAHGAEGVMFFCWRKRPAGYEMLSNGLIEHDGRPRRTYFEMAELGRDFAALARALPDYESPREVAVLYDFADRAVSEINPTVIDQPALAEVEKWIVAANALGLSVRVARPTDDLAGFPLVLAPALFVATPAIAANLRRYVEGGGALLGMQRLGLLNAEGNPPGEPMPAGMTELFGCEIEEYERVMEANANTLEFTGAAPGSIEAREWICALNLRGARTWATIGRDFAAGWPCATIQEVGHGQALFLGAVVDGAGAERILRAVAGLAGLDPTPEDWPDDVERARLRTPEGRAVEAWFNHSPREARLIAPGKGWTDLVTGALSPAERDLPPLGFCWLGRA